MFNRICGSFTLILHLVFQAGAPCENEYPPLPAYQSDSEPEKKEVYIVQVKGLPWSCSAQDLLQFFAGEHHTSA